MFGLLLFLYVLSVSCCLLCLFVVVIKLWFIVVFRLVLCARGSFFVVVSLMCVGCCMLLFVVCSV